MSSKITRKDFFWCLFTAGSLAGTAAYGYKFLLEMQPEWNYDSIDEAFADFSAKKVDSSTYWLHNLTVESVSPYPVGSNVGLALSDGYSRMTGIAAPPLKTDWVDEIRNFVKPKDRRFYLQGTVGWSAAVSANVGDVVNVCLYSTFPKGDYSRRSGAIVCFEKVG